MMMHCSMNNIIITNNHSFLLFWILLVSILQQQITTSSASSKESQILIKFKHSFENSSAIIGWDAKNKNPPCTGDKSNWDGVLCDNGSVWGLKLENLGLTGDVNVDSLSELKSLRTISLMYNSFTTSLPNISKLGSLKTIYLSFNKFSGQIPSDAFKGMASLKKVHLAHNNFSGSIPSSLTTVPKLMELMLDHNLFEGKIPSFPQKRLIYANFSSNRLSGHIPTTLSKLNASSFSDNEDLCGAPLLTQCPTSPRVSIPAMAMILVAIFIAVGAIIAVIIILSRQRKTIPHEDQEEHHITTVITDISPKKNDTTATSPPSPTAADFDTMGRGSMMPASTTADDGSQQPISKIHDHGTIIKLTFLGDDIERFDITDLLKASAEVLGNGLFGSSYKVSLTHDGQTMVVKRYRQMNNVSKEEFQEHMRRLGGLSHPNLLPISAFYCKKEEKLFISHYIENVNLAALLHGSEYRGEMRPDWARRLKIVKGVSKGVLHLYNSLPSLISPHGHLKSSNVLLTQNCDEPLLTDYGLIPVVNLRHAEAQMMAYKSPEFRLTGRITKKSDVWSLGILILEVLTGKFPPNFLHQGYTNTRGRNNSDLSTWVLSVIQDDQWTAMDVFDPEMMKEGSLVRTSKTQMIKLLEIALRCCEVEIGKRLDIREAVEMIQEIKERDNSSGGDFFPSYTSDDGDIHSSNEI